MCQLFENLYENDADENWKFNGTHTETDGVSAFYCDW